MSFIMGKDKNFQELFKLHKDLYPETKSAKLQAQVDFCTQVKENFEDPIEPRLLELYTKLTKRKKTLNILVKAQDRMAAVFFPFQCDENECIKNLDSLYHMTRHEIYAWMQIHRVLPEGRVCAQCNLRMTLRRDRNQFQCGKSIFDVKYPDSQEKCNFSVSQYQGSFFEGSHLKMKTIFKFSGYWLHIHHPRQALIMRELEMSSDTVVNWSSFCREVCFRYLLDRSVRIGSHGHIVEIDKAEIGYRKYNQGGDIDGQWIFSGIDRTTRETFIAPVHSLGADSLIPVLLQWVEPGSTVVSDQWAEYSTLWTRDYTHLTANHSLNFVDPTTGANTQKVERLWRDVRGGVPRYGNKRHHMHGHIAEFLFKRKIHFKSRLHEFWSEGVREMYPCI